MTWLRLRRGIPVDSCRKAADLREELFFRAGVFQDSGLLLLPTAYQHTLGGEQFESLFQTEREWYYCAHRNYGRFDHVYGNGLHPVG